MKKILGLVVLSLFAISASAADLMASSAAPTVTQNIVVEGAACPGVGATGFSSTGLLLSCQSGVWAAPKASISGYRNCQWLTGAAYSTRICPQPKVQIGFNYIGYGGGYSDHHSYCCELY